MAYIAIEALDIYNPSNQEQIKELDIKNKTPVT